MRRVPEALECDQEQTRGGCEALRIMGVRMDALDRREQEHYTTLKALVDKVFWLLVATATGTWGQLAIHMWQGRGHLGGG